MITLDRILNKERIKAASERVIVSRETNKSKHTLCACIHKLNVSPALQAVSLEQKEMLTKYAYAHTNKLAHKGKNTHT